MSHLVQKDENGEFFMALAMKEPLSAVSVNGIGPVVVPIFNNPDCYVGMKIGIAGDKMTMDEYVAIIKTLKYNQVSYEAFTQFPIPGADSMASMFEYYNLYNPYDINLTCGSYYSYF